MVFECKDKKHINGSVEYFAARPTLKEIFVSEDGQYFESVSRSNFHCKAHDLKLFKIDRAQIPKPAPKEPEKKAPEAKAPEAKAPEAKKPEVKKPEAKKPEVKAPMKKKAAGTAKKPSKSE